jgi:2'-5' RNA ligase
MLTQASKASAWDKSEIEMTPSERAYTLNPQEQRVKAIQDERLEEWRIKKLTPNNDSIKTAKRDELHIGLGIPKPIGIEIHNWAEEQDWPEGTELEPIEEYHITMLYAPETSDVFSEKEQGWPEDQHAVTIKDIKAFPSKEKGEGQDAIVLTCDSDTIREHHDQLADRAEDHGIEISPYSHDDFKPHMTIAYGSLPKGLKPPKLTFETEISSVSPPREDIDDGTEQEHVKGDKKDHQKRAHTWRIARVRPSYESQLLHFIADWNDEDESYYHMAPTEDRARIMQHGLQVSHPRLNPAWGEADNEEAGSVAHQPEGVYLAPHPEDAGGGVDIRGDLWKVDPSYIDEAIDDPIFPDTGMTVALHSILPEALTLHEPYEHTQNAENELKEPGSYWRERQEKEILPEWKIGQPTAKVADSWNPKDQWPNALRERNGEPVDVDCTCKDGHKLDCPCHGLHPTLPTYDDSLDFPDPSSPVGYDYHTDAPRTWMRAETKVSDNQGNQLNWEPGTPGKGMLDPQGNVHTWPTSGQDGRPSHVQYAEKVFGLNHPKGMVNEGGDYDPHGGEWEGQPTTFWDTCFNISQAGRVKFYKPRPDQYGENDPRDYRHIVEQADPRIKDVGFKGKEQYWDFQSRLAFTRHKLWLDDTRHPPDESWDWAKDASEAKKLAKDNDYAHMSLDHDLGIVKYEGKVVINPDALSGGDFVIWLHEHRKHMPKSVNIHSHNAKGIGIMKELLEKHTDVTTDRAPDDLEEDWAREFKVHEPSEIEKEVVNLPEHIGGLTQPQRARALEQVGPDTSQVVHEFPDQWRIHKLVTPEDRQREGQLMHNCWAKGLRGTGREIDGETEYTNEPYKTLDDFSIDNFGGQYPYHQWMSLRDPTGYPHASFFLSGHPGDQAINNALGHGNASITEPSSIKLREFAKAHGYSPDPTESSKSWQTAYARVAGEQLTALPMENGLYYRAHHPDAPWWGTEHAETVPIEDNGISDTMREKYRKPGYSSFWNPHHLSEYMSHMSWDPQDRWVVGFRGKPVGEGIDGEPRVIPTSSVPEFAMPWQDFEDNLEATPNGYGKWDEHTWGDGPDGKMADDGYRSFREASHQLAWLPGSGIPGKGLVTPSGDVHTWAVNVQGSPHHAEYMDSHAPYQLGEGSAHFFNIRPRGGLDTKAHPVPADIINHIFQTVPSLRSGEHTDWHFGADQSDTREYPDARMMPPTTMQEPAQGNPHPEKEGCTCDQGHKLDCPVHGLNPTEENSDHSWSIPEGHPVGYPQDQPRNYMKAEGSVNDGGNQHDSEAYRSADKNGTKESAYDRGEGDQQKGIGVDHAYSVACDCPGCLQQREHVWHMQSPGASSESWGGLPRAEGATDEDEHEDDLEGGDIAMPKPPQEIRKKRKEREDLELVQS